LKPSHNTMGTIDLHVHTTASDGTMSPTDVVHLAKEKNLKAIAITDHDTIDGIEEAQEVGNHLSVEIIPGIEISANFRNGSLHLLGYFIETGEGILTTKLARLKEARSERNPQIVEKLKRLGVEITYQDVLEASGGGQVGRPHFAQVLVDRGYVRSINEAFDRYLARGGTAYVDKYRFEIGEAIDVVLEAGGVPVLAHPRTLNFSREDLKRFVTTLAHRGLMGIEVFYPEHSAGQRRRFRSLAEKLGLVQTGGSDFHGPPVKATELGFIGEGISLPYSMVSNLKKAKQRALQTL
jgi:predicted metal-dependent phosphoesterase TrpH